MLSEPYFEALKTMRWGGGGGGGLCTPAWIRHCMMVSLTGDN